MIDPVLTTRNRDDALDSWQEVVELLEGEDLARLESYLEQLSPHQTARAISRLTPDQQRRLFGLLPPEHAADLVIEQLSDPQAVLVLAELAPARSAAILDHLPSDEQTDLIGQLDPQQAEVVLQHMAPQESADVRHLRTYPEETAGALMVTEFLSFTENNTVEAVVADLRRNAARYMNHDVQHLHVVSAAGRLKGVLSLRDLVLSQGDQRVSTVMVRDPLQLNTGTSLEELAEFFDKEELSAVPITDMEGRLVGVVERASVEEALAERAEAKLRKFSGLIAGEEFRSMPVHMRALRRLIWLSITIVLNLIAASVIGLYQATLAEIIALAVFLPVISGMGGSAGNQAIAVSMRELSLGLIKPNELAWVLLKEISVGAINGVVLGTFIGTVAWLWNGNIYLGLIVGTALALSNLVAVCLGGSLPLLLKRWKVDPALAAGPVLMTVADMCGFFLALSFASIMLTQLRN